MPSRLFTLIALLASTLLLLAPGCGDGAATDSANSGTSGNLPPIKPPVPPSEPSGVSEQAREVAKLLDSRSFDAARTLLIAYLPQRPSDAWLYLQAVRYVVASDSGITIPALQLTVNNTNHGVKTLTARVVQFDASLASAAADVLVRETFHHWETFVNEFEANRVAPDGNHRSSDDSYSKLVEIVMNEDAQIISFGQNSRDDLLNLRHAIDLDANIAGKWIDAFEKLARRSPMTVPTTIRGIAVLDAKRAVEIYDEVYKPFMEKLNGELEAGRQARLLKPPLDLGSGVKMDLVHIKARANAS